MKNNMITASSLIAASLLSGANAAITITSVNDVTTSIGADEFAFSTGNSGTAFYFGNSSGSADLIPLSGNLQYYFQSAAPTITLSSTSLGSARAYRFNSNPTSDVAAGINFVVFDIDQDGFADTVFKLNFGTDISDSSDDLIVEYAFDDSQDGIDVFSAVTALAVPEPSSSLLFCLGALSFSFRRIRTL